MVDKGLVLKAIEVILKGKSASKNFKESIAEKWAAKIEKEEDIDSYLEDREDVLVEASAEADRRAFSAAKKARDEAKKVREEALKKYLQNGGEDGDDSDEDDNPDQGDANTPDWAKALISQNKKLNERFEAFETSNKQKTISERFLSHADIKGLNLPDSVKKRYTPTSEEEFETSIESLKTDFQPLIEANALSAYGNDKPSGGGIRKDASQVKKISADDAKKIVEQMNT